MSELESPSSFCVLCYKTVVISAQVYENQKNIHKFVKIVKRLVKSRETDTFYKPLVTEKLLKCCNKCKSVIEDVCGIYNQLKVLELKFNYKLDNLAEKINYANKVPTRWMHVNKVLEETFLNDLSKKAECQQEIRKFRQNIIEAGYQRKLQSQPRVLLSRTENIIEFVKPSGLTTINDLPSYPETEESEAEIMPCPKDDKTVECPKCGKTLKSFKWLKDHLELHKDKTEWKYECHWCSRKFYRQTNLNIHLRSHTLERPFKCRFCKKEYRYRSHFTGHMKKLHSNEKGVEKELKRNWFSKRDNTESLTETKLLKSIETSEIDEESIEDRNGDNYDNKVCPKCGKILKSTKSLKIHLEHHKDESKWKWKCYLCSKRFTTQPKLNVHMRTHTGESPFKCKFCDVKFADRYVLTNHLKFNHAYDTGMRKEIQRKWLNISLNTIFRNEDTPNKLSNTEELNQAPNIMNSDDDIEYDDMPLLDDYSEDTENEVEFDLDENYSTRPKDALEGQDNNDDIMSSNMERIEDTANFQDPLIQIKVEHQVFIEDKPRNIKRKDTTYQNITSKKLPRLKVIKKKPIKKKSHKNSQKLKWRCKTCGKISGGRLSFQLHMKMHTRKKLVKCRFCGIMYAYQWYLRNHLKEKHSKEKGIEEEIRENSILNTEKPLTKTSFTQIESQIRDKKFSFCKDCGKPFPTLKILKAHMNSTLCTKKPNKAKEILKCEECKKIFRSDKELWRHQREIHEEKVCLDCGKHFRKTFNFKIHLEYHKDPKEWKFECEICGKKCVSSCKLKEHRANHNRENYKRNPRIVKEGTEETNLKSYRKVANHKRRCIVVKPQESRNGQKIECRDCGMVFYLKKSYGCIRGMLMKLRCV